MSKINYSRQEQFSKLQVIKSKWRRKLETLLSIIGWLIQHSWPVRPAPPSPPHTGKSVQMAFSPRVKLRSPVSERGVLTQWILWAGAKRQNRTSGNGLLRKKKIPDYERHVTHRAALHIHLHTVTGESKSIWTRQRGFPGVVEKHCGSISAYLDIFEIFMWLLGNWSIYKGCMNVWKECKISKRSK